MLKLINASLIPPGGWRYEDEVGGLFKGATVNQLKGRVKSFREANGKEFDEKKWEHELCSQLGLGNTQCGEPPPVLPKGRIMGIGDLDAFARTLVAFIENGGRTVPQEEAERRAAICVKCPENLKVRGCIGCFTFVRLMTKTLGKKCSLDKELKSCNICGCTLSAKIHVPEEVMHKVPQPRKPFPSWCWMNTQEE